MPHDGVMRPPRTRRGAALLVVALLATACSSSGGDVDRNVVADGPQASVEPTAASPSPSPSPSPTPAPEPPAVLAWQPCDDGFECAVLPVPLDRDDPTRTVDLAVTRRLTADPAMRLGSLVVNPGGPGASAVEFLQRAWQQVPEPVRARFDLVAYDPRGVGRSAAVRCASTAELDAYHALDPSPDDAQELQAYLDGQLRFTQGCAARSGELLPHVSTDVAARDMDRLRASLGDERLTYLGYSYGTSLGASYLQQFPERVRAMVLDGGIDPSLTWDELVGGQARGFDAALAAFLADCEATRCAFRRAAEGDLTAAFDRVAAAVEQAPLPASGGRTVGPGEFSLGVGAGLYSRATGWPALAQGLAEAASGTGRTLLALSDAYLERTDDGYANLVAANFAVNCLDRPWPRETAPYLALAERLRADAPRFGPAIALSGLGCGVWPVAATDTPVPVRAEGAAPVVVIGTTRDPATPYAWSQALADQLASGVLVTYEGDGHTVYRSGAPDCVREPVNNYLVTGEAPAPLTC
jgi:pimeloyl-ACP methyl ester carboxylesterase